MTPGTYSRMTPLPPEAAAELVQDNPRLVALRKRYAALNSARCRHSFWSEEYRQRDLDLPWFRGDNVYVWQLRNLPELTAARYGLYLRYVADIDERDLLGALREDGLFGCWTFTTPGHPVASRDLIDSVNELTYLQRMCKIFDRRDLRVLDIGAGYGRLAHRAAEALPNLDRWFCTDGVPDSTFLCEWYLQFRGCDDRAVVVPADEVELLPVGAIDVAVNVHSFSEMALESIAAWVDELTRLRIPRLLIVPNEPDRLVSYESNHGRLDILPVLTERGFDLQTVEPIIRPPHLQKMIGIPDSFWWFASTSTSHEPLGAVPSPKHKPSNITDCSLRADLEPHCWAGG